MDGARNVAGAKFRILADIQEHGVLMVVEPGGFQRADRAHAAAAAFQEQEQGQGAQESRNQDRVITGEFEQAGQVHSVSLGVSLRWCAVSRRRR